MATKTVTIDTNEWLYPDKTGITHTVTNAETFTFELTDDTMASGTVEYRIDVGQSVTTEDGLTIYFRTDDKHTVLNPTDAEEGVVTKRVGIGDWVIEDPVSGEEQRWHPSSFEVDNADAPTEITATFEDQFGNTFSWDTVTVA